MPRFVANQITVEAHQFLGDTSPWPESFRRAVLRHLAGGITEIQTGDGPRPCRYSDWMISGPGGYSIVRAAAFEAMFAALAVDDDHPKRPHKKA
jgi:hypothetical protein